MATRFFYLPWRSRHDLGNGGVPRFASGWAGYDYPGDGKQPAELGLGSYFKLYNPYSSGGMPQFAVTQDPDRVPLVETGLPVTLEYSSPFPHFSPSSYGGSQCAYVNEGRAYNYTDTVDPCAHFYSLRPFANFVYRLAGTGSIDILNFLYRTTDSNSYLYPGTAYTKLRLDDWDTYPFYSSAYHRVQIMFIGPATIYVYRPGTGVVQQISTLNGIGGGYMPGHYFSPPMQREYVDTAGATNRYFGHLFQSGRTYASSVEWQDGDLLVWELWASHAGAPIHSYTSAFKTCAFVVGGGASGQPTTTTDGYPDWAPAWQARGTITGYEPSAPRQPQVSVGF